MTLDLFGKLDGIEENTLHPKFKLLRDNPALDGERKPLFERLRPSHNPELEGQLHFVNNYRGGKFGFTSSHAANVFALAFYLTLLAGKRLK